MNCDNCGNLATIHLTEIRDGKKSERHLCQQCAAKQCGTKLDTPIVEVLRQFVEKHAKEHLERPPE